MERNERHYHLQLTNEESETIVRALNERADELHGGADPAQQPRSVRALADRIEQASRKYDPLSLGAQLIRTWYYGRVRDLAVDALEEIISGRLSDSDALQEYVHESVDGTDIVIYTYKASAALLASDNEDAHEEFGFENPTVEQRAYCALEADVWELLHSGFHPEGTVLPDGFDVDDDSTWTAEEDEEEPTDLSGTIGGAS